MSEDEFYNVLLYRSAAAALYGRDLGKPSGEGWGITPDGARESVRRMLKAHKGDFQSAIKECEDYLEHGCGFAG